MLLSNKFVASNALGGIGLTLLKHPDPLGAQFLTLHLAPADLVQMTGSTASFHPLSTEEI